MCIQTVRTAAAATETLTQVRGSYVQLQLVVGAGGLGTNQGHDRTTVNVLRDWRGLRGLQLRFLFSPPNHQPFGTSRSSAHAAPHLAPSLGLQHPWRDASSLGQSLRCQPCFGYVGEPTHPGLAPSLPSTKSSGTNKRNLQKRKKTTTLALAWEYCCLWTFVKAIEDIPKS